MKKTLEQDPDLFSADAYESTVTFEDKWYLLNDAHYNIVAVIDDAALPVERVHYDSYGKPHHHYWADLDGDGGVSQGELDDIATLGDIFQFPGDPTEIHEQGYIAYADYDRDGDIDFDDWNAWDSEGTHAAQSPDTLSANGPGNIFGFNGYAYYESGNNGVFELYNARNRWLDSEYGRWPTRDPAGPSDLGTCRRRALEAPVADITPIVRKGMGDDVAAVRGQQVDRPQHGDQRTALRERCAGRSVSNGDG